MTLTRQALRRFTWLALTAMLGLALAPTVSRALSVLHTGHGTSLADAAHTAPQHHDCEDAATAEAHHATSTAEAAEAAPTPIVHPGGHGEHGSGTAGNHDHLNHCPLCGVAATAWTIVSATACWNVRAPDPARHAVALAEAAPRAATALAAHRPRGPPRQA